MEPNKWPLKRLPQVTMWELQRHTLTIRNPLAWDKPGSDKPIQRDIGDLSELCLHRAGEGTKPLFDRDDVLVNQDGMEERTMRVHRSRSSSSSSGSSSSASDSVRSHSKSIPEVVNRNPKPVRFACEKRPAAKNSSEAQKERKSSDDSYSNKRKRDRKSLSPCRKQSVSPYRKQYRDASRSPRRSPVRRSPGRSARRSPVQSRLGRSPERSGRSYLRQERSPQAGTSSHRPERSPHRTERSEKSPRRAARSPHAARKSPRRKERSPVRAGRSPHRNGRSPLRTGRTQRSPERSREGKRRKSRSLSASGRTRRSRSPHRPGTRYREFTKGRRSPGRRPTRSPHGEEDEMSVYHGQVPPIDYTHLAHVITQMYPRQPFVAPHLVPQPPEFYPPYGIPAPQLPMRPRYPLRPPIVYNNRTIRIFRPAESTATSGASGVTDNLTTSSEHEKSGSEPNVKRDTVAVGNKLTSSGENSGV